MMTNETNEAGVIQPSRYYERERKRLIFLREAASPQFWDRRWSANDGQPSGKTPQDSFVTRITGRFLVPEDGPILEGGCGKGNQVAALSRLGYRCIGIDFAEKTVRRIQSRSPDLDVRLGDVRRLEFPDRYFAGYWSLGVIEHFWEGYQGIAREMARVVGPGGYLFISFPYLSPLRKAKAKLGMYPSWKTTGAAPGRFYQFALNDREVIDNLQAEGFQLENRIAWDGIKGTKDEVRLLRPLLQPLYDYRGGSILIRAARFALTRLLAVFAAHIMILVLRREVQD